VSGIRILSGLAVAALAAACSAEPAAPVADEVILAQDVQVIAQEVGATTGTTHQRWLARLRDTLLTTDDPEAQAFMAQARAYRDSAHQAFEAGDFGAARRYRHLAFRAVLSAVVEIFPNAPVRTGAAVDQAIARIEQYLGTREAPRIRAVLAHVRDLRNQADRALANGEPVVALAINLRALEILHRMVEHLRAGIDHDGEADVRMEGSVTADL
jgi:hypothetical protein